MRVRNLSLIATSPLAVSLALLTSPAAAQEVAQPGEATPGTEACGTLSGSERDACLNAQNAAPPPGDPQEEAILVTGSRIPRANYDTAQPAVVLGSEQIEQRGYTNLADALEELPAFGAPG